MPLGQSTQQRKEDLKAKTLCGRKVTHRRPLHALEIQLKLKPKTLTPALKSAKGPIPPPRSLSPANAASPAAR